MGTLTTGTNNVVLQLANPRPTFSITPEPKSRVFGAGDPALTFTTPVGALVGSDTLVGSLTRAAGEDVGAYAIQQGTVNNASNANYDITFVSDDLEITPAPVTTGVAANQTIAYGGSAATFTATATGLLGGNALGAVEFWYSGNGYGPSTTQPTGGGTYTVNSVTAPEGLASGDSLGATTYVYQGTGGTTYGPSTTAPTDVGSYSITPSSVTIVGSAPSNYTIGYAAGTLTITPKPVTVTANDLTVGFGAVLAPTSSVPGLEGSDALDDVTYTYSGGGYGPSTTPPTTLGTYIMTPTVVSLAPGSAGNYTFTYTSGTLTILSTRVGGLFPDRGTYLGGTVFTITGLGFGPQGSLPTVSFGGRPATGVVLVNSQMIMGITPDFTLAQEYTEERVNVVVTVTGGGTVTLPLAYTYLPPRPTPVMMTVFPPLGPTSGGTQLTITGDHLGGSNRMPPTVLVNGAAARSVTVSQDGSIVTALTPPGPAGVPRDVELFTNEGAAGFVSVFTYIPPLSPLVTLPVPTTASTPRSTTTTAPPRSTTTTVPEPAGPNRPPPGVEPVRVPDASGNTALPTLSPGESLALDNGVPVPVSVTVENNTDLVMNGQDWQLRLRGDCSVRTCTILEQNGREVLELEVDGAARVGGFGFMPGTLVHLWLFSTPTYMGSVLVAADGTYSGAVDLIGIEVGQHTLQANGISFDGKERTANLGVVVRTDLEPGGRLPSTGTSNTDSTVLMALLLTALGLVLVTNRRRRLS